MNPNTNPILKSPTRRLSRWPAALMAAAFAAILAGGIVPVRATTDPITITIGGKGTYPTLSPVLNGYSTEVGAISTNASGEYFFAATNTQLVQLFKNVNFAMMRIGGNSADDPRGSLWPSDADIDTGMGFAKACGMRVIYQLNLKNGNAADDEARASYLFNNTNYGSYMWDVGIGNEPNLYGSANNALDITNFSIYMVDWNSFAATINAPALGGPDASEGGRDWIGEWAGGISGVSPTDMHYHFDACGNLQSGESTYTQCQDMLTSAMDSSTYPTLLSYLTANVGSLRWDFTEFNGHNSDNHFRATNSETCYGEALFILDALHWWGQNGANSLDVFGGLGSSPNNGYHIMYYYDADGTLQACPQLYGSKAYDVGGGGGQPIHVTMDNPNNLNVTAYDVRKYNNHYITIINKELGLSTPDASVSIGNPPGYVVGTMSIMFLRQQDGDITSPIGVTLGGDVITGTNVWNGTWTTLSSLNNIVIPKKTAAIVRLTP